MSCTSRADVRHTALNLPRSSLETWMNQVFGWWLISNIELLVIRVPGDGVSIADSVVLLSMENDRFDSSAMDTSYFLILLLRYFHNLFPLFKCSFTLWDLIRFDWWLACICVCSFYTWRVNFDWFVRRVLRGIKGICLIDCSLNSKLILSYFSSHFVKLLLVHISWSN
jgi:hypothetical protein